MIIGMALDKRMVKDQGEVGCLGNNVLSVLIFIYSLLSFISFHWWLVLFYFILSFILNEKFYFSVFHFNI